ncbi:hypothetical protein UYSO10_3454 [Kosakonia radicincitans]|nr:hypothetical protein UYSO10_3454 [Kosakonia radicincitans]
MLRNFISTQKRNAPAQQQLKPFAKTGKICSLSGPAVNFRKF